MTSSIIQRINAIAGNLAFSLFPTMLSIVSYVRVRIHQPFSRTPLSFHAPTSIDREHIVRASVCLSTKILLHWPYLLIDNSAFIFKTSIPCDMPFLLATSSRSSVKVKVKYQVHCFRKKWPLRGYLFFTNTSSSLRVANWNVT